MGRGSNTPPTGKDHYATLGLTSSATSEEIKKAYRHLARDKHPDACDNDPAIAEEFKRITEAYNTLTDAEQRREYDNKQSIFTATTRRAAQKVNEMRDQAQAKAEARKAKEAADALQKEMDDLYAEIKGQNKTATPDGETEYNPEDDSFAAVWADAKNTAQKHASKTVGKVEGKMGRFSKLVDESLKRMGEK